MPAEEGLQKAQHSPAEPEEGCPKLLEEGLASSRSTPVRIHHSAPDILSVNSVMERREGET